jgi:hypothetical protein
MGKDEDADQLFLPAKNDHGEKRHLRVLGVA